MITIFVFGRSCRSLPKTARWRYDFPNGMLLNCGMPCSGAVSAMMDECRPNRETRSLSI
jgi:hypothetical protein